ncbi:MAG: DUF4115 domain-containing protein, partial [Oleiphilaceae bacterium]|nr:DUF4115 domain-containing protein [Oleiphilaceae bacterium]
LVVLVLVLLPFIWPQSDGPDTGEAQPSGSEEQRQPSDTETGADIGTDGFENSSGARNNEVSPALNEVETLDAPSSEPAPVEEDGSDASTGSNGNTAGQPSSSEPLEPVEPQPPRVESLTDSNESAPDGRDAQQQVRLEIRFRDDCWVEVVNGEGTRVVARLATAGDQVRYSGPGPLSVLLGAVGAVERAEFMGQTLDMDGYPARAGRVRFQLAQNDFDSDQD